MVNFQELKSRLKRLQGKNIVVSTVGVVDVTMGLEKCIVMDYSGRDVKGISICNLNNVLDGENPVSINIKEENIKDFMVTECDENEEFMVSFKDGQTMIIVGCSL